jgi:hypothetical protein
MARRTHSRACGTKELEDAESTKDKKFVKRKTILKKIVANITMGNDSRAKPRFLFIFLLPTHMLCLVSQLFPDIIRCMPIQVLEIKKSEYARYRAHRCATLKRSQWCICTWSVTDVANPIKSNKLSHSF